MNACPSVNIEDALSNLFPKQLQIYEVAQPMAFAAEAPTEHYFVFNVTSNTILRQDLAFQYKTKHRGPWTARNDHTRFLKILTKERQLIALSEIFPIHMISYSC